MTDIPNPIRRPLRSYVLRQGRISHAQQRAYETLLPIYSLPYQAAIIDLDAVFGRSWAQSIRNWFRYG